MPCLAQAGSLLLANTPPCSLNYTDVSATNSGASASISSLPTSQTYEFAVLIQSSSTMNAGGVSLYLKKLQEASGTFEVAIRGNMNGIPGGALATASVPLSSIGTAAYSWVDLDFAAPAILQADNYWVTGTVKAGATVSWYAIANSDYCTLGSAKQRMCSFDPPNYCSDSSGWGSWSDIIYGKKPLFKIKTSYTPPQTCSDGTVYSQCSSTKPKYCNNGVLINKCSVCGCTADYGCQADETCAAAPSPAIQGVSSSQITKNSAAVSFTTTTSLYGEIIYGMVSCTQLQNKLTESTAKTSHTFSLTQLSPGTTYYYIASAKTSPTATSGISAPCASFTTLADNGGNQTTSKCSDNTVYGACSTTKPKYCQQGTLVDKCSSCGCAQGYSCNLQTEACASIQTTNQTTPPAVVSVSPLNSGKDVPLTTKVSVTFNVAMDKIATENAFSLYTRPAGPYVSGTKEWSNNDKTLTFTPSASLSQNIQYSAQVLATAKSAAGVGFPSNYSWSFTTESTTAGICSDGTTYGTCSASKPKYCEAGTLVNKCGTCGCAEGYECNSQTETCSKKNNPPVAIAGDDMTIQSNTQVTFDASQSYDADGDSLTYVWKFSDTPLTSNQKTYQRPFIAPGTYTVTLEVSDGKATVQDSLTVVVTAVQPPETTNEKQASNYEARLVFVISDENWKDVLSLVPVGVWEDNTGLHKYPILVYHKETQLFDSESMITFLNDYNPMKIKIIGSTPQELLNQFTAAKPVGAELQPGQIVSLNPSDYFSFWKSFNAVVVVDYDNYEAGLMASVYASYKNIPIVFVNANNLNTYKPILSGKKVIIVGTLDSSTQSYISQNSPQATAYTLAELQQKYVQETNTDKVILVNPNDLNLNIPISEPIYFKITTTTNNHYIHSLTAPLLGASKKEAIIFTNIPRITSIDTLAAYNSVDDTIESEVLRLFGSNSPKYLTIIAPPIMIPDSLKYSSSKTDQLLRLAVDWSYGSMNSILLPQTILYADTSPVLTTPLERIQGRNDLLTGRIYSYTTTDVSAYLARAIFFEQMYAETYLNTPKAVVASCIPESEGASTGIANLHNKLKTNGYSSSCYTYFNKPDCIQYCSDWDHQMPASEAEMKQFILYSGHGGNSAWRKTLSVANLPRLFGSYMFGEACLTNIYLFIMPNTNKIGGSVQETFGESTLRKGAIAYTGAISILYGNTGTRPRTALETMTQNTAVTLGEIDKKLRQFKDYEYPQISADKEIDEQGINEYNRAMILLGDPTVAIRAKQVNWQ